MYQQVTFYRSQFQIQKDYFEEKKFIMTKNALVRVAHNGEPIATLSCFL